MKIQPLAISDAWLCTPQQFTDGRGVFLEWFRADLLRAATGRRFDVAQANHSQSVRGTLRGVHYADVPPGQAKYVYCPRGAVLDVIVDLRVGSPTFGHHATIRLDDAVRSGVFLSEGLGHAFCALSETADVTYLVSTAYNPVAEHGINPLDPDLGLSWPTEAGELILSDKDSAAPGLVAARHDRALPTYDACLERYATLRGE